MDLVSRFSILTKFPQPSPVVQQLTSLSLDVPFVDVEPPQSPTISHISLVVCADPHVGFGRGAHPKSYPTLKQRMRMLCASVIIPTGKEPVLKFIIEAQLSSKKPYTLKRDGVVEA